MSEAAKKHSEKQVDTFMESLQRCVSKDGFFDQFYMYFLDSHDAVKLAFQQTKFERQLHMLEKSLRLAAVAVIGGDAGVEELHKRSISHDIHHLNIDPGLYSFWLEAIVKAASEFDALWCDEAEQSWRKVMTYVIDAMAAGHEQSMPRSLGQN